MVAPVIVLFTQDLRLDDHPALTTALEGAGPVLPLFVLDHALLRRAARNRLAHLAEALADLRSGLRAVGGDLVIRRGDTVMEILALARETGARTVHLSAGVSRTADRRLVRLREAGLDVHTHPGLTVVPPGDITPTTGDHYKVFTPYWRSWEATRWRETRPAPARVALPEGLDPGHLPVGEDLAREGVGALSPERQAGGWTRARDRLRVWLRSGIADYGDRHDDLAGAATSHLSADLRFGCLSPLEVARARMITAAFLTRTLRVHWKEGAAHFDAHLTDGDVADDYGNWQWVAGTGNDTRPNRAFNPSRQAKRFDPEGVYVRRYVPELAGLPGARVHSPWLEEVDEGSEGYPLPIADPGRR